MCGNLDVPLFGALSQQLVLMRMSLLLVLMVWGQFVGYQFVQAVKSIHLLVFLWCAVCFLLEWYAYASVLIVFDFTT